jgi:hypothetical protein
MVDGAWPVNTGTGVSGVFPRLSLEITEEIKEEQHS